MFSVTNGLDSLKNSLSHLRNSKDERVIKSLRLIDDIIRKINPMIFSRIKNTHTLQKYINKSIWWKEAYLQAERKFNSEIISLKKPEAKRKREIEKREVLNFFKNNAEQIDLLFRLRKELENIKDLLPFLKECTEAPLNISRGLMPQIQDIEEFLEALLDSGINWESKEMNISDIKSTQNEFDREKIENLKKNPPKQPLFIISNDGYLLDGHHRWITLKEISPNMKVSVVQTQTGILDLLQKSLNFINT